MADEGASGGSKKKLIMLGGGGLLVAALLGGGGFFAYKKFFKPKAKPGPTEPPPPPDPEAEDKAWEKKHPGAPSIMIYDRIVNLEGRKSGFLKCALHIVFRDPGLGKLATDEKPSLEKSQIEALLLDKLSGLTVEEVMDKETRATLAKDLKDLLNEKFDPDLKEVDPKEKKAKDAPKRPVKEVLVVAWAVQL